VARTIASKRDGALRKPLAAGAGGVREAEAHATGLGDAEQGARPPLLQSRAAGQAETLKAHGDGGGQDAAATATADPVGTAAPAAQPPPERPGELRAAIDLGRVAWLLTVLTLLAGMAVLGLKGDYGYAATALAVALAAAINLL